MKYIYKLLDETTYKILLEKNAISLSRPITTDFEHEAVGFKIFKFFMKFDLKNTPVKELYANSELKEVVNNWIQGYLDSIPTELKGEYKQKNILLIDIENIMSEYFRTYCGYLTSDSLDDEAACRAYLNKKKNRGFAHKKTHCVKIPIERNHLNFFATNWENIGDDIYQFHKVIDTNNSRVYDDAVLHTHGVKYVESSKLELPFAYFNSDKNRKISSLLKYVDDEYYNQAEERFMLWIPIRNIEKQTVEQFSTDSFEEMMIYKFRKICLEALDYPKYIYLKIDGYEIIPLKPAK